MKYEKSWEKNCMKYSSMTRKNIFYIDFKYLEQFLAIRQSLGISLKIVLIINMPITCNLKSKSKLEKFIGFETEPKKITFLIPLIYPKNYFG